MARGQNHHLKNWVCLLALVLSTASAFAQQADANGEAGDEDEKYVHSSENLQKYSFDLGVMMTQVSSTSGSLSGYGITIGGSYLATDKASLALSFAQAFGQGTGSSSMLSLYSAIQAEGSYAVIGNRRYTENLVSIDGRPMLLEKRPRSWTLNLGLGFDQYWFNGSTTVYPASGLAYIVSSDVNVFGYWIRPNIRFNSLTTGTSQSISATSFGIKFEF